MFDPGETIGEWLKYANISNTILITLLLPDMGLCLIPQTTLDQATA